MTLPVQTIPQQTTTQESYSMVLRFRTHPVRSLISDMVATGFYPENEIREWEEMFFIDTGPGSNQDQLIFLLTEWVLPAGDPETESEVRKTLNLPDATIDQLIEKQEKAASKEKAKETVRIKKKERIQTVVLECLQERANTAEAMNQRLARQYTSETNQIFALSDSILAMSKARTTQLTALEECIANEKKQLNSNGAQVVSLLQQKKNLQEERKEMLQVARGNL